MLHGASRAIAGGLAQRCDKIAQIDSRAIEGQGALPEI